MSFQTFERSEERQSSNQVAAATEVSGTVATENLAISETKFLGKLERLLVKEEKAETSKEPREIQWSSIFQRMSHLVWVLTPTGILLEANGAALKLGNQELARVKGCQLWETGWCSPTTAVEVIKAIAAGSVGNNWRRQLLLPTTDGTEVILDFQVQPVLDETGKVVQLLAEGYELGRRISGARQGTKTHSKTGTKDAVRSPIVPETGEFVPSKSSSRLNGSKTPSSVRRAISPKEPITQPTTDLCTCVSEPGFQSRAELEQSLSLMQAILDDQPEGILAFTIEGVVTAVNQRVESIWQLGEAALDIRELNQWLPLLANQCRDEAASRQQLEKLMGETPPEGTREIITLKDGKLLEHQCHPLRVNQRLVGKVWKFKEVTERSREEEARRQVETSPHLAPTKTQDLSQWRTPSGVGVASPSGVGVASVLAHQSDFISMLCHEFRKPLNTISLAVSALQNYGSRWPEEKKSQYMQRIHNAVYQVDRLLNDVMIIGRAEALMVQCSPQPLSLKGFCRDLITKIELERGKRNPIAFSGNIAQTDSDEIFNLDEHFLKSILTNLLDNAFKYSASGSPVNLEVNTQGEEVIFRVQDQGIGIPKAAQHKLGQLFHRAENVGDISGFGVGLAVVQKLVTIHGGQITWISQEGKGTTFVVKLPRRYQAHRC